jgi:L-seryl-tRNA(Ser) seleniumtransferase
MSSLRDLPSIDQLLQQPVVTSWISDFGRPLTLDALRQSLDLARQGFYQSKQIPANNEILDQAFKKLQGWTLPSIQPVINATGVILHTNLGRAPLS